MSDDLELALRIRTDLVASRRELREYRGELQGVTGATRTTSTELGKVDAANTKVAASTKAVGAATAQTATGLQRESKALGDVEKNTRAVDRATRDYERTATRAAQQLARGNVSGAGNALIAGGGRGLVSSAPAMGLALTGLAAAIAITIKALHDGEAAHLGYDRALITTGGHVGKTREELHAFAKQLDALPGVTTRRAAAAVAEIAATSGLAGEQYEIAARAALQWSEATGAALDDTVAKFKRLREDPVAALLELTEKENFLTAAQLARIRVLIEEGREQEAVTEAFRIYGDVIDDRAPRMAESLGTIATAMRGIKRISDEVWDGIVQGLEHVTTTVRKGSPGMMGNLLRYLNLRGGGSNGAGAAASAEPTVDAAEERKQQEAQKEWQRQTERYLSDRLRMEKEIATAREIGAKSGRSEAEIETQVAAIRKTYADREARRGGKKLTDTQRAEQAAQRELDNLTRQATLLGELEDGEKRVTEEARIRYETTEGGYRLASAALKQQLLDQAKRVDATRAEQEAEKERQRELKETERSYEQLRAALRTPAEAAVATAAAQIEDLNKALDAGIAKAPEYQDALRRIMDSAGRAPLLDQMPWDDLTGLGYEQSRLDDYAEQLRKYFDVRAEIIAEGRAKGQETEEFWRQQELAMEQEHQARLADLLRARRQLAVASTQSMFDSMAEIARHGAGEQSKAYQVLFAISKGFAVAQAAVALAQNVAEASKVGYPQNLVLIAAAFAQGAQIAALLSSANYSGAAGYATGGRIAGPGTGTSDSIPIWASNDEFMVRAKSAREPGAYSFLEDFNRRGMDAVRERRGFAEGGRITHDPMTTSNPGYPTPDQGALSTSVINQMRLYLFQDMDQLRGALLNHPAAEKWSVATIGANGNAVQAEWR